MIEMALLFGLGVMGVILSNLLAGDGGPTQGGIATLPRPEHGTVDGDQPEEVPPEEVPSEEVADEVVPPGDRPSLWGHPAPLAKFIALISAGSAVLTSVVWGAGWLLARAIARAMAGG